jgi:four helix bundle protein
MQDFKSLRVWQLARSIIGDVVQALPPTRARLIPGLRSQVIRAATSVAANIAEGCGRPTRMEFLSFLDIALASLNELEAHLLVARDARLLSASELARLGDKMIVARRMIVSLQRTIQMRIAQAESERRYSALRQSRRS